jgi:DNA invertase Pin-like site-specific DNA recombinase
MTVIGYARVSTTDQDLSIQEAALKVEAVRSSGRRSGAAPRPRDARRSPPCWNAGDVLMVTRIDRLARSIGDLQDTLSCTLKIG